jgi:uncharacterized protein YndB with AHSA1/START domain
MATTTVSMQQTIQQFEVVKEEEITAPIDVVFETILEQMGPYNETPDGKSLSMKLEAWPGGRWFRDLGNNQGHLWGHVQSIKAPELLEIHGPLFMSGPVVSHVLYRLSAEGGKTRLRFSHRAIGLIPPEAADGVRVGAGWGSMISRMRDKAEARAKERK